MNTWGGSTQSGFAPVPHLFLDRYESLGLSAQEAMVVIHILRFSWFDGQLPYPKMDTLARSMGKTRKTIMGYVNDLEEKGVVRIAKKSGKVNVYDFQPLFDKLRAAPAPESQEKPKLRKLAPLSKGVKTTPTVGNEITHEVEPELIISNSSPPVRERPTTLPYKPTGVHTQESVAWYTPPKTLASESKAQRKRRLFDEKSPSQYNCNDMEFYMRDVFESAGRSCPPPSFTGKDRKQMKCLIDDYGGDKVSRVIEEVVRNWDVVRRRYGINGHPTVAMFYGWRGTLFPAVLEGELSQSQALNKAGSSQYQYEEPKVTAPPQSGWGDLT